MSKVCDICGKGAQTGNHRSHALNASKRKFYPNLSKMKAEIKGEVKKIKICSKCLKSNKVIKVV
ncbi:MAG: 50S ribosomal protein L28 [Candidatus Cloacimonadales bacterium]